MKKFYKYAIAIVIIVASGIILFLLNNNKDEQVENNFSKAQLVEVYDCSTNELITKYQSKDDIEKLIKNLNVEKWDMAEKETEDLKKYLIKLYKKPTKTLLKKENNELKEIATITVYNSGEYADFSISKMNLTFKTNKDISSLFD